MNTVEMDLNSNADILVLQRLKKGEFTVIKYDTAGTYL